MKRCLYELILSKNICIITLSEIQLQVSPYVCRKDKALNLDSVKLDRSQVLILLATENGLVRAALVAGFMSSS